MAETTEKVTFQTLMKKAYDLGQDHGEGAATYYWYDSGPDMVTIADARKVLKGIEDGDPEVMDSLPNPDLSGQMADGMTPKKLYDAIDVPQAFLDVEEVLMMGLFDDVCTAYEDGFRIAVENAVRNSCTAYLSREITINIEGTFDCDEDNLKLLMKDLEDVINKHNGDFNDMTITDQETDDDITPSDM